MGRHGGCSGLGSARPCTAHGRCTGSDRPAEGPARAAGAHQAFICVHTFCYLKDAAEEEQQPTIEVVHIAAIRICLCRITVKDLLLCCFPFLQVQSLALAYARAWAAASPPNRLALGALGLNGALAAVASIFAEHGTAGRSSQKDLLHLMGKLHGDRQYVAGV